LYLLTTFAINDRWTDRRGFGATSTGDIHAFRASKENTGSTAEAETLAGFHCFAFAWLMLAKIVARLNQGLDSL
jgi:hypothetical protein